MTMNFGQTLGGGEGRGGLACCSPWGREESDTTWRLNHSKMYFGQYYYRSGAVRFLVRRIRRCRTLTGLLTGDADLNPSVMTLSARSLQRNHSP